LHHLKHVFYFQKISKINGIQVPFTLGIQTPMQCQSMLTYGHNGAISIGMPLTWIVTSQKIVDDLIEWLKPLKAKVLSIMPNWK